VQITPIYSEESYDINDNILLKTTQVKNGEFIVRGKSGSMFYWCVFAKRLDIQVEPDKLNASVKGNGPYKWI